MHHTPITIRRPKKCKDESLSFSEKHHHYCVCKFLYIQWLVCFIIFYSGIDTKLKLNKLRKCKSCNQQLVVSVHINIYSVITTYDYWPFESRKEKCIWLATHLVQWPIRLFFSSKIFIHFLQVDSIPSRIYYSNFNYWSCLLFVKIKILII